MDFQHVSVLLKESIDGLNIKPNGIYVDGTLGGGGHSLEICKKLSSKGKLIGIDQDDNAIKKAMEILEEHKEKTIFVHDNFSNINNILENNNIDFIDGIILDLGVSSHQLDEKDRGFSYMQDAPLDMRMDRRSSLSAYEIVNEYSGNELNRVIFDFGEERWAKRIAQFITIERKTKPIETTFELVEVIKKAIPKAARKDGPHPAKRTFQGIRIEVNKELDILKDTIINVTEKLNSGGRLSIITFHSLEDRIIKNTFRHLANPCNCPKEFPICICNKKPEIKIVTRKPITASLDELEENHRARSAKLRVAEKL